MAERHRLCVGKLTPRGMRLLVPHDRIGELAEVAGRLRQHGHELTISASPATLKGRAPDTGVRVTVRRPSK